MIRKELTTEIRFEIAYLAYQAQYNKIYGEITSLANRYKICRAFVYVLLNRLKEYISTIFSPKEQEKKIGKKEIIARVLMLRMVGGSSIQAISSLSSSQTAFGSILIYCKSYKYNIQYSQIQFGN